MGVAKAIKKVIIITLRKAKLAPFSLILTFLTSMLSYNIAELFIWYCVIGAMNLFFPYDL